VQSAAHPERRIGRRTGLVVEALVAVLISVLLLGAAEWAAGVYLRWRAAEVTAANVQLAQQDFVSGVLAWMDINPVLLVPDAELLWRNRPGSEKTQPVNPRAFGRPATWTATIDARGFRGGPERLAPAHPGVYRVLCVGDSITYGFNVDAADTYPRQLEALLAARHPGRRFEVINAGVAGWSWIQGRRFLELEGLALRPDAVVIGHGTNDQFFPATITDAERIGRATGPFARLGRRLAAALARTNLYHAARVLWPPTEEPSPGCAAQPPGVCRRVSIPEIERTVGEVRELTRAAGADLVLVNPDFMETPAVEGLRRAEASLSIGYLDLVSRLRSLQRAAEDDRARERGLAPGGAAPAAAPDAPRSVVLRVVGAPAGASLRVAGRTAFGAAFEFDEPLRDDGAGGDERAGDGVHSTTLALPPGVGAIEYRYLADGVPELEPLPPLPSTQGARLIAIGEGVRGPIERFGAFDWMAERTHPDAQGQAIVAAAVADALAALPSFARFVAEPAQRDAADASRR